MNYSLELQLDEKTKEEIKKINNQLDYIMDELFMGKVLSNEEIINDKKLLEDIKTEFYVLIEYQKSILKDDATLLSKTAGRSFIISYLSVLSAFIVPLMAIPSIIAFSRGMKYYTSYKVLSNKEVIDEYLSYFDSILSRIDNYENVFNVKYSENNKNKMLLLKK